LKAGSLGKREAEAVEVLDHLPAHRLHQVRARLAGADDRPGAQAHEGAQLGQVALEQRLERRPVALRGEPRQLPDVVGHGHRRA
jgi:hypothetical protein